MISPRPVALGSGAEPCMFVGVCMLSLLASLGLLSIAEGL